MLTTSDLPSFRHEGSSKSLISFESRLMAMENGRENLVTENKKLHARVFVLEESKTSLKLSQVIDRLHK